jgi:hypothetical protein
MALNFFAEEQHSMYDAPPLDDDLIRRAERALGVRLPRAYLGALTERNGGILARQTYRVDFSSAGGDGTIGVEALLGVGGRWGVDVMSRYLVEEWEYPPGIVVCMPPSGGHDTVMLDYAACGPRGEPAIVYVDEERVPRRIAHDFQTFLDGLT